MYRPYTTYENWVPAFEISYSFKGHPIPPDENGNDGFNFSVYFRPDELAPAVRQRLSSSATGGIAAAEFFQIMTFRPSVETTAIDAANATHCDGSFVDGNWTHTNGSCEDKIAYKAPAGESPFITVKVAAVSERSAKAFVAGRED